VDWPARGADFVAGVAGIQEDQQLGPVFTNGHLHEDVLAPTAELRPDDVSPISWDRTGAASSGAASSCPESPDA
jgi:hypothetical protein